jgi:hypothetical protein
MIWRGCGVVSRAVRVQAFGLALVFVAVHALLLHAQARTLARALA